MKLEEMDGLEDLIIEFNNSNNKIMNKNNISSNISQIYLDKVINLNTENNNQINVNRTMSRSISNNLNSNGIKTIEFQFNPW